MVAKHYVENKSTLRGTAHYFGVSKSWVHTLIKDKLIEFDYGLYTEALEVMNFNKKARASRGGKARHSKEVKRNGNSKKAKVCS